MKLLKSHALLPLALAAALAGCAQQASAPAAASAPKAAASQAAAVSRQALAQGLYEIVYSAKQDAVFVTSAGGRGEGTAPAKILRLHPETLAVQAEILMERKGFGLAVDDANNRLYIGNTNDGAVTAVGAAAWFRGHRTGLIRLKSVEGLPLLERVPAGDVSRTVQWLVLGALDAAGQERSDG